MPGGSRRTDPGKVRRAMELRRDLERHVFLQRGDSDDWRRAWRAREKWFERYERAAEGWYEDLQSRTNLDAAVREATRAWSRTQRRIRKAAPPPSRDEVIAALRQGLDPRAWERGAVSAYVGLALDIGEDAGQFALDALGIDKTFQWASPRDFVMDPFRVQGSKVIQGTYGEHLNKLAGAVIRATRPGQPLGHGEVVRVIREEWSELRPWQARRVARTETARAWETINHNAMRLNGVRQIEPIVATGPSIGVETSAVDETCTDIAANGPYDMDDADMIPPYHPNCRCTVLPVYPDGWLPPRDPWAGEVEELMGF